MKKKNCLSKAARFIKKRSRFLGIMMVLVVIAVMLIVQLVAAVAVKKPGGTPAIDPGEGETPAKELEGEGTGELGEGAIPLGEGGGFVTCHDYDNDGFFGGALCMVADKDCDDADRYTYPGATERCDGVDNDCDGLTPTDEIDADSDGFMVCHDDCDDTDILVFPGAEELCGDGVDNDCNGRVDEICVPGGEYDDLLTVEGRPGDLEAADPLDTEFAELEFSDLETDEFGNPVWDIDNFYLTALSYANFVIDWDLGPERPMDTRTPLDDLADPEAIVDVFVNPVLGSLGVGAEVASQKAKLSDIGQLLINNLGDGTVFGLAVVSSAAADPGLVLLAARGTTVGAIAKSDALQDGIGTVARGGIGVIDATVDVYAEGDLGLYSEATGAVPDSYGVYALGKQIGAYLVGKNIGGAAEGSVAGVHGIATDASGIAGAVGYNTISGSLGLIGYEDAAGKKYGFYTSDPAKTGGLFEVVNNSTAETVLGDGTATVNGLVQFQNLRLPWIVFNDLSILVTTAPVYFPRMITFSAADLTTEKKFKIEEAVDIHFVDGGILAQEASEVIFETDRAPAGAGGMVLYDGGDLHAEGQIEAEEIGLFYINQLTSISGHETIASCESGDFLVSCTAEAFTGSRKEIHGARPVGETASCHASLSYPQVSDGPESVGTTKVYAFCFNPGGVGPGTPCDDADGDGYGFPGGNPLCAHLEEDCNDGDPLTHPFADEICDGYDNDCDGAVPANEADADGDGWMICEGDCDDGAVTAHPGGTEDPCNGIDEDCDGDDFLPEDCANGVDDDCDLATDCDDTQCTGIPPCDVVDCLVGCDDWVTVGGCGDDGCSGGRKPQTRTCDLGYESCDTERCALCGGIPGFECCTEGATECPYTGEGGLQQRKSCIVDDADCAPRKAWSAWADCSCAFMITPPGYYACRDCMCTTVDRCACSYWLTADMFEYEWAYFTEVGGTFEPILGEFLEDLGLPEIGYIIP